MDFKPTNVKKAKKITKTRALEIERRKDSTTQLRLTAVDERRKSFLSPADLVDVVRAAPGSRRASCIDPAQIEELQKRKEGAYGDEEEDNNSNGVEELKIDQTIGALENLELLQEENVIGEQNNCEDDFEDDLWALTNVAITEQHWKNKVRRVSTRRRSSEVSETDTTAAKVTMDKLRKKKAVDIIERRKSSGPTPKYFWDDVAK